MTLTAHKISSFQAKTIILSPFYSQKHNDFLKRKTIFGVIGTWRFKSQNILEQLVLLSIFSSKYIGLTKAPLCLFLGQKSSATLQARL